METTQQKDAKDTKPSQVTAKHRDVFQQASDEAESQYQNAVTAGGMSHEEAREIALDAGAAFLAEHFPGTIPSKARPTEPGWYWQIINNQATVVGIVRAPSGRLWVNGLFPVDELSGEWVRIEPPISLCPLRPSVPPSPPLFPSLPSVQKS